MEQPKETTAKAKAQGGAAFGFEAERCVVKAQFADAFAQLFKVGGVGREQAAEHDGLHFLKPGERFGGRALCIGDGVTNAGLRDFLNLRGDDSDFARGDFGKDLQLWPHTSDAVDQMLCAGGHELDFLALFDRAVDHANQYDDAQIRVIP